MDFKDAVTLSAILNLRHDQPRMCFEKTIRELGRIFTAVSIMFGDIPMYTTQTALLELAY